MEAVNDEIYDALRGFEAEDQRRIDQALIDLMPKVDRIRYAAPDRVPARVFAAAAQTGFYISRTRVYMEGRLELLQYYQQQSVCHNYHRYGNLGARGLLE